MEEASADSWSMAGIGLSVPYAASSPSSAVSVGSSGEQARVLRGGGTAGEPAVGISDGARVGIVSINFDDFGTGVCCGGRIGKKGAKICIKTDCSVAAHSNKATKAFNVESTDLEVQHMVFVKANPEQVYLTPRVPLDAFTEDQFEENKGRKQTHFQISAG